MTSHSSVLRQYLDILNETQTQTIPAGAAPTAQAPIDPLYQKYNQIRGTLQSYEKLTGTQPGDKSMQGSIDAGSLAMINKMKTDLATAEKQLIAKGYTKQQLDAPFQQKTTSEPLDQNQGWQESKSRSESLKEHIEEIENEGPLSSGDYFHIELSEDEGIETWVIAEWSESVLIEAD